MTTRCHSVFSLRSPVALSRQLSEVATLRLAIGRPSWVRRISGSLPRFPTRITLFTLPAIAALHSRKHWIGQRLGYPLELWHCLLGPACLLGPPLTDPIRSPLPRARRSLGYPHIACLARMFQFCSISRGCGFASPSRCDLRKNGGILVAKSSITNP